MVGLSGADGPPENASFAEVFSSFRDRSEGPASDQHQVSTSVNSVRIAASPQLPHIPHNLRNSIIVNRRQQGNPLLRHIRNVRWQFADERLSQTLAPDYLLGASSCALYISLRYHLLHPQYLLFRIRQLQGAFRLRIVLCYVDAEGDVARPLQDVTKAALLHGCTLLCAWSVEECARYLETLKSYENKPAKLIQERVDGDYVSRLTSALTTVRHVNKTDVLTLATNFGTLSGILGASMEDLSKCPGIGEKKVKRLYEAFHEPFRPKRQKQAPRLTLPLPLQGRSIEVAKPIVQVHTFPETKEVQHTSSNYSQTHQSTSAVSEQKE